MDGVGHTGVTKVDPNLKWLDLFHLPSGQKGSVLGMFHITVVRQVLLPLIWSAMEGREYLEIRGNGALDNLMNAIELRSKIPNWTLENTKINRVREIRKVTAMDEIKKQSTNKSVGWELSSGGKA